MESKEYSRRTFISKWFGTGSLILGGAVVIKSCDLKKPAVEDKKEASANFSCDDFSRVSKSEMEKRQKFAYVEKSPVAENYCGNCSMYVPQGQEKACGGCMLFKGPVLASGYCIQYVVKV